MAIWGALVGGAKFLAGAGIIRGTAGRILRGARRAAGGRPGVIPTLPGRIPKIVRTGAGVAAGGAAFELGGRLVRGGGERKRYRRINPTNPKALKRALRRIEQFEKLVKRSFIVKDIKPRKRSCR